MDLTNVGSINGGAAGPYLPLSAGSSYPLTGNLYLESSNTDVVMSGNTSGNFTIDNNTGNIAFNANGSSVQSMNITSSLITINEPTNFTNGNVGIGTTSPSAKLEVTGNTRLGSGTFHVSSDATLITSSTYTFRDGVYINNPNSTSAAVASGNVMSIGASSGNTVFTSLITTGAIGIGKSNPSAQLDVVGTGNFTGLVSGITPVAAANFVTKAYVDGSGGGTGPFLPLAGGTMTAGAVVTFLASSGSTDDRLKFGASGQMQLFHDGSDGYIINSLGDVRMDVNTFRVRSSSGTETMIKAIRDKMMNYSKTKIRENRLNYEA